MSDQVDRCPAVISFLAPQAAQIAVARTAPSSDMVIAPRFSQELDLKPLAGAVPCRSNSVLLVLTADKVAGAIAWGALGGL